MRHTYNSCDANFFALLGFNVADDPRAYGDKGGDLSWFDAEGTGTSGGAAGVVERATTVRSGKRGNGAMASFHDGRYAGDDNTTTCCGSTEAGGGAAGGRRGQAQLSERTCIRL